MRSIIKIFTLNISLFLLCALSSKAQQKPGGNSTPIKDVKSSSLNFEYVANDPLQARIYTLQNGMKVYLTVNKNEPRIQTYIAVKAGSKNDPADATGLAHYLEHMVFKGTDKFGSKNWAKESVEIKKIENLYETYRKTTDTPSRKKIYHQIDSISGVASRYAIANEYDKMLASIGASGTNAFTSLDETVYQNDIPANQIDNFLKIESERFSKLVLRLFHTELEAVYEEKNRGLDSDQDKVFEAAMAALWKKHTYGTQTTIGTIDHLKNPSMVEINKYFDRYYVPNNMAIILSGDLDPDKTIKQIEKHFGKLKPKPVPAFNVAKEDEIKSKIPITIYGPDPDNVSLAWRTAGIGTREDILMSVISSILYNGTAGLLDLHLNQTQKVLSSNAFYWPNKDYSMFSVGAQPKEGQSLEEAEKLIIEQIEKLGKGDFPDWILDAVLTEIKLRKTKELENNNSRAGLMLESFTKDIKWAEQVNKIEQMSKITKKDIMEFAATNLNSNNYVVVYKRSGEDKSVQKVEKPEITPVEVNSNDISPFASAILNSKVNPIKPVFIDYTKDIQSAKIKTSTTLLYNQNKENKLFELYYKFDFGKNADKVLPIAVDFIPYVSTKDMTAEKIQEEFYKLGCTLDVFSDNENTWVRMIGLNDNMEAGIALLEKILAEPVVEDEKLKALINDLLKEREDQKHNKEVILKNALVNYTIYGPDNAFTHVLSNEEMLKLNPEIIKDKITGMLSYEHKVLYYGPSTINDITATLEKFHRVPTQLKKSPESRNFQIKKLNNEVLYTDFDMKQAEIMVLSNGKLYDSTLVPVTFLFNAYFGSGMNSVLYQDLRESKALAYSAYSQFSLPNKKNKQTFNVSYIGSQADKLNEAMKGLNALLNEMPKAESAFQSAKDMVLQEIASQRIIRSAIIFNYLQAVDLGHYGDIRRSIYTKVKNYTFADIKKFYDQSIKGKEKTVVIVGKKELLDLKVLEKYGPVKFVPLKELFGY